MRLTDRITLSPDDDLDAVALDIASIRHSSLTTTPLGQLRYGAVPLAEARAWLESSTRVELRRELATYPRIVAGLGRDNGGEHVTRIEHLVVRDLDLDSLATTVTHSPGSQGEGVSTAAAGRIVAYAEFMYHPPPPPPGAAEPESIIPTTPTDLHFSPPSPPPSVHRALHEHWDRTVEAALAAQFGGLHCFEVRGLGTLAPSHLRRGIASTLLAWIFPWADRLGVPVVLAATPAGYPFYLRHGFVEVEDDHDSGCSSSSKRCFVECDMAQWGGSGIHRHVLMIRRPKRVEADPM